MEDVGYAATAIDPLLACCLCRRLLQEALQLACLHSCCRQCFSTAASKDSSQGINCGLCGTVTQAGSEKPNAFIDNQVLHYKSITESIACQLCKENDEGDKPAVLWCPACRQWLCGNCDIRHGQYFRLHATQSLEEHRNLHERCLPETASAVCAIHKRPVDIACLDCKQTMCISCWASCKEKKHEMHIVGREAFDSYVSNLIGNLLKLENELLAKAEVLEKPKSIIGDRKVARDRHLKELNMRKRRLLEAVEMVYQEIEPSTKSAYDDIAGEGKDETAIADRIASALSDARSYIRRLVESKDKCEIINQQKIVQQRLSVLSTELDSLSDRLSTTIREVRIEASLPEDLEDTVRAWVGMPLLCTASSSSPPLVPELHVQQQEQQQQCYSFGAASASVHLPVECWDVALTKDGRSLLLAAREHGLLEFCSSCGHEMSRWRPPKYSTDKDEQVQAVAALSEERVAVCLYWARLIVLLGRRAKVGCSSSGTAAAAGDAWTEDLRFEPLPWHVWKLSAHGDVLAASELHGPGLQLLSVRSERLLSDAVLLSDYVIGSLALAAGLLVTGSLYKVELGAGRQAAHVLEAHSITEGGRDERLWHQVLNSSDEGEEQLWGVCADSNGGCLYAALCRSDRSSSRVCVLSLADGSELRRIALSLEPPALPWKLSLSDCEAAAASEQQRQQRSDSGSSGSRGRVVLLAALHYNETTVTVHRGTRVLLQQD